MADGRRVFQISGIKDRCRKGLLLRGIRHLGGRYIGGSFYDETITHLIVSHILASEKFIAAVAGGKWVVSPEYVEDSVKQKDWLPEGFYEVNLTAHRSLGPNPVQKWRKMVARGQRSGAFEGWVVLLILDNPVQTGIFTRILKAGRAEVHTEALGSITFTHVLAKYVTSDMKRLGETCLTFSGLAYHLFGMACSELSLLIGPLIEASPVENPSIHPTETQGGQVPVMEDDTVALPKRVFDKVPERKVEMVDLTELEDDEFSDMDDVIELTDDPEEDNEDKFSSLEIKLQDYISEIEVIKNRKEMSLFPEFIGYCGVSPSSQRPLVHFESVQTLLENEFYFEALDEVRVSLQPAVQPPLEQMHMLMKHALQGEASPYFLSKFWKVLHEILWNNCPWASSSNAEYFCSVLQCPQCKKGLWPLLSSSYRVCMSSTNMCHVLPRPYLDQQLQFQCDLQDFVLRLFQLELHALSSCNRKAGISHSVLGKVFFGIWERTTLISKPVQKLVELLVEASVWADTKRQALQSCLGQKLVLRLQQMLGVVVDFWCQYNSIHNRSLVEKSLQDFGDHIAILCQDLPHEVLSELIPSMQCSRLRLLTVDALFKNICRRNAVTIGPEPLSLQKIVSSYLKALSILCVQQPVITTQSEYTPSHCISRVVNSDPAKQNIPRRIDRVNAAGETLLHRACKRNQVDKLLNILSLPETDVNVKDHAGWTPLHEACNHGSNACVRALLQHKQAIDLTSQVDGVSPLHDALLNGHMHIAQMLLEHTGSALLQLRDNSGLTPLDLVSSVTKREELLHWAEAGDAAQHTQLSSDIQDLAFVECCSSLLGSLLLNYQLERDVPSNPALLSLPHGLAQELFSHGAKEVTKGWGDCRAVRMAYDLDALMRMGRYMPLVSPALKQCLGPHTQLLIQLLEDLEAQGKLLCGTNRQLEGPGECSTEQHLSV
ncbi:SMC5-SMC6 complex localization factor protein 1 isoform X2 [Denticeps clupeoides]|uniref:BRCT domain-containing protein n=2 Tax=Denticeps clupeoides TaxID=299321 RepID=A0AAY4AK71_9TELE|nr:SMC5-SMC6 complex localization factor protein 1 isoform X2 [Denticeps clupeoides]XP_028830882.1 SMC5-SMC6 complex localization factor protein 1 isoform X2 [Denticeps clupeoides]XP_028830883.1 SMC5-SMC6 complex localization factor protein 1 isoform X2 [Denticeps clupeoides]XP_028830884.1 SMC5-SMC6 complex localization factor protein 1 isoform X2 [Denticeps clupeoides]